MKRNEKNESAPRIVSKGDLLREFQLDMETLFRSRASNQNGGPVTGIKKLDAALGGCLSDGLHVIHGGPGVGKTAFCLQLASDCGCPVLLLTCEMRPLELLKRLTARQTKTYLGRLKSGELDPAVAGDLARKTAEKLPHLTFMDGTQAYHEPSAIEAAADAARELIPDNPHLLVIVDSAHSWADSCPGPSIEYDMLNFHIQTLRAISARLSCVVILVAERNRYSMKNGGISASAGSRKFEYSAETVIELDMDPEETPDMNGYKRLTLKLSKNRHGEIGRGIELLFHGAMQSFVDANEVNATLSRFRR